jgi:putative MATE family efflux protein
MAVGAGVVIARHFGAKRYDEMRKAIHTDVAFGLVAGVAFSAVTAAFTPQILRLLNTPEEILPYSVEYFRVYFAGSFTAVVYNIFVGIMQAVGDSKHPLYYLIFSSCLNVVLDLLFIGVFGWGVFAASLATVISQGVSALLCLIRLVRIKDCYRISLKEIRFHKGYLGKIVRLGLPSGVQNSVIAIANLFVQSNVYTFDQAIISGFGCYGKVEGFAFLPVTCFSMALTNFIGQNLGAGEVERAKKGARFGILCSCGLAALIGVAIFFMSPFLISLFTTDADVIANGVRQSRSESLFYTLLAFSHAVAGVCRGAGRATTPMVVMLSCWCVIRVSGLAVLLSVWRDIRLVYFAYPTTWALSSLCFLLFYLFSDWTGERKLKKKGAGTR